MRSSQAKPQAVKLNELTDLVAAIPYSIGFHPTESLVVVALHSPRDRMGFTMRLDLPEPAYDDEVAAMCAERMAFAGAAAAVVFVYTDEEHEPGLLPRVSLVEAIVDKLSVPLRDAVLVRAGRAWSYLCADHRCCPPEGLELRPESPGALTLAAAHAFNGDVVLADRDALVATTRCVGGVTVLSMRQAIDRAVDAFERDHAAGRLVEASLALVDRICTDYARGPARLSHDDAAALALRTHNVVFRDELLGRLARGDEPLERLVGDLARLAQPPFDAPAATMLGVAGYFRGDGVVGLAAAERALVSDPDYSLAQLLREAIAGQMHPKHMRRVWAKYRR